MKTAYVVFKPRRLTAEELRDAMLRVSGEWNPQIGGIPNRPEIHLEAAFQPRQVMGTFWIFSRNGTKCITKKMLGLEDHKLTYYHAGRFKQLSQFGGQVIKKIIA